MRPNRLREIWAEGGAAVTGWLSVDSPFIAELLAHLPFDCLTLDMQHGLIDYQGAVQMLQAISTTGMTPTARIPWNDPAIIMKMLDAGIYGLICPMVNSKEEAEAFVGACRYPPKGYRSFGPRRATVYAGEDYPEYANETVVTMAMIETGDAVKNLEEILSVGELDAIYVGPADLSLSLTNQRSFDYTDPELMAVLDHILVTAQKFGTPAGIHTGSPAFANQMIEKGFQFVAIQNETAYMISEAKRVLSEVGRTGAPAPSRPAGPYG